MQKVKIELKITLADGGISGREIIDLYGARIVDDIDQIAWNRCECNDQIQSQNFSGLNLEHWIVKQKRGEDFKITALLTALVESPEFADQIIEEYMDGFGDWISGTANGLYSRTGVRAAFNPNPLEWNANIT